MKPQAARKTVEALQNAMSDEAKAWNAFVSARTAEERCHAWLALVCDKVPGIHVGAVLIENPADRSFVPIAVWPKGSTELGRLGAAVEATLRERRGVVKAVEEAAEKKHLTYPLFTGQNIAGVVVLEAACTEQQVPVILRDVHWAAAWLSNMLIERDLDQAEKSQQRIASVMETLAVALRHGKLQQALFEVANTLRHHFASSRVAIGLVKGIKVKMAALSEAATFEKHSLLVKAYEHAMEECFDQGRPMGSLGENDNPPAAPEHDALRAVSGAGAALSFPLSVAAECVAVLTLEREEKPFSPEELDWLEAFGALAAPVIEQRREAERGMFRRLALDIRKVLEKIFGPQHLTWKAVTAGILLATAIMVLTPVEYRVSAKTVIEGEVQRAVTAPFGGFISAAYVRAGDTVTGGDLMAQLDDRELRIEEAKWSSERDQYENRLREALAKNDLTAIQVVGAQLRQSTAQLNLVTERIARANIAAPFDGIVVSGDLSQQIGAPVEEGKGLFEIAPLQSYRIILQVDERDIRLIEQDQPGRLLMTGIAGEPMDFTVAKVTPVATAQDGKNFFRVEAVLQNASPRLRPGMEGIGKIDTGKRSLWWSLTHNFTDWLVLTLWRWMP